MRILATGITGLIGSRIVELLPDFEFTSLSRKNGVDITQPQSIETYFQSFDGEWVLHMGAKADVDGCERDREMGEEGEAWKINVVGTQNMASLAKKYRKKIIYISTDFVFDGKKPEGQSYTEEDNPGPINWYGETKYQGELRVKDSGAESSILRIAYPYGESSAEKKDFARVIAARLKEGLPVKGVTDHIMCPTYIDDIANGLRTIVEGNSLGLYHLVGSTPLSPYDAAVIIAQKVGVDPSVIGKVTREEYFAGKAARPSNLNLKNDKIKALGLDIKTFKEGLDLMQL